MSADPASSWGAVGFHAKHSTPRISISPVRRPAPSQSSRAHVAIGRDARAPFIPGQKPISYPRHPMDLMTIVQHVEQWTTTEVHELKAWLDLHVLHRAANTPSAPTVAAPSAPVAETATATPGEHTDGA